MSGAITWKADEPETNGTVGGDGAGEAMSVRFTPAGIDLSPHPMVTVNVYTVDLRDRGADDTEEFPWGVERQVEYLICTDPEDPGGTEVWSTYEYDEPTAFAYRTEADATAVRDFVIRHTTTENMHLYWDGEPTK